MRRLVSASFIAGSEESYYSKTSKCIALLALMVIEVSRKIGGKS